MKVTWLGQSGFLLEDEKISIIIDPYFTDSVSALRAEFTRMMPVETAYARRKYDLLLFTHCHLDHTDPETVRTLVECNPELLMAGPCSAYKKVQDMAAEAKLYAVLKPGGGIFIGDYQIEAVPAYHTDSEAVGYIIGHGNKKVYFSGDTVLTGALLERAPADVDAMFLCINGAGNNMSAEDALRLVKTAAPRLVVPCHFGMFPQPVDVDGFINSVQKFGIEAVKPEVYKTVVEL